MSGSAILEIESARCRPGRRCSITLPENSPLLGVFDAALTDALAKKGITAKVAHNTIEPTLARPERTIEFQIATPAIGVANVKLNGVAEELAPLIQKSVNAAAKVPYSERTTDLVLAPLRDAGYIQAALSGTTLEPKIDGDKASVVLSATLVPGDVYRVSVINFAGEPLLAADAFAATEKLHPGDIASQALLMQTLAPLDAAYRRQGYMDVVVEATPAIDAAAHQVAYTVTVTPGEQYRINKVTANNLDPVARDNFDRRFTMKTGDLYNPEYVTGFLKNNSSALRWRDTASIQGLRRPEQPHRRPGPDVLPRRRLGLGLAEFARPSSSSFGGQRLVRHARAARLTCHS